MRALIIEEKDVAALLDGLTAIGARHDGDGVGVGQAESEAWSSLAPGMQQEIIWTLHGKFSRAVIRWFKQQGADLP